MGLYFMYISRVDSRSPKTLSYVPYLYLLRMCISHPYLLRMGTLQSYLLHCVHFTHIYCACLQLTHTFCACVHLIQIYCAYIELIYIEQASHGLKRPISNKKKRIEMVILSFSLKMLCACAQNREIFESGDVSVI